MRIFGATVFGGRVIAGVLGCLILMLAVFLGSGCSREAGSGEVLYIVSPHGSDIRREFAQAFSKWHEGRYGAKVDIQWPDMGGGTGSIAQYLETNYVRNKRNTCDYDLVFGGGSATFNDFAARGYLQPLPEEIVKMVPDAIHGTPLHQPQFFWVAATMSNFGIVVNKDRMKELGITPPKVWEDLTGPQWFGHVSLADPSKSGSVRSSYELLFQQYGWERGWADMVLLFGNTEMVRESGSSPSDDVGSAQAAGGIVIDFFAMNHITRVGSGIMDFVIPAGGSTIDPDPIALLKGAPHERVAVRFVEFVVSPEGQRLWTFRPGVPGGPKRSALGRFSVLPSLYETSADQMKYPSNPFTAISPLKANASEARIRSAFIGDLIKYCLIDNHEELVRARRAVREAGDPPELLAKLSALPTFEPAKLSWVGTTGASGPESASSQAVGVQAMTAGRLREVSTLYKSTDKSTAERNQAEMRSHWQKEFRARFEEVEAEAKGMKAGGKTGGAH